MTMPNPFGLALLTQDPISQRLPLLNCQGSRPTGLKKRTFRMGNILGLYKACSDNFDFKLLFAKSLFRILNIFFIFKGSSILRFNFQKRTNKRSSSTSEIKNLILSWISGLSIKSFSGWLVIFHYIILYTLSCYQKHLAIYFYILEWTLFILSTEHRVSFDGETKLWKIWDRSDNELKDYRL